MPAKFAAIAGLVLLCVLPSAASDRVLFLPLPTGQLATSVGGNAFMAAGTYYNGGGFSWMPTTGDHGVGGNSVTKISRDGKTLVGDVNDSRAYENAGIWTAADGWHLLGPIRPSAAPCDALLTAAYGSTDDASVVVGLGWDGCSYARGFRWDATNGMVDLGSANGRSTRANAVSNDGRTIVGWTTDVTGFRRAVKWVNLKEEIIEGPNALLGEAHGVNSDASIIVGEGCDPGATITSSPAWMWTRETGVKCYPVEHPDWLPPLRFYPYRPFMQDLTDDGRIVVGFYSFGLDSEALLWIDGRVHFLKDYLAANGLRDAFKGWINTGFLNDVSPDGRTLVGYGAGPRGFQGYMVILPEGAK